MTTRTDRHAATGRAAGGVRRWRTAGALGLAAALLCPGASALADPAAPAWLKTSVQLKSDLVGVLAGGVARGTRHVDTLDLALDADLSRAGDGIVVHVDLLVSGGGAPNELAGSLQGINNAEVANRRTRLYQAWVEKDFSAANLRLGFSDLNTEFDVADAAGLLLGPAFGVGGEFAGTGSAGPSLYPSTAFGVRLRLDRGAAYGQAALVDARAGGAEDLDDLDVTFKDGVLAIAEYGWTGRGKLAVGAWAYGHRQPHIRATDAAGDPARTLSHGVYGLVEQPIAALSTPVRTTTAFLKAGLSEGRATPLVGGWQAGLYVTPALASRPDSAASLGLSQVRLSRSAIANRRDADEGRAAPETQWEAAYSDKLNAHLAIQPDLQLIWNRDAVRGEPLLVVGSVRVTIGF